MVNTQHTIYNKSSSNTNTAAIIRTRRTLDNTIGRSELYIAYSQTCTYRRVAMLFTHLIVNEKWFWSIERVTPVTDRPYTGVVQHRRTSRVPGIPEHKSQKTKQTKNPKILHQGDKPKFVRLTKTVCPRGLRYVKNIESIRLQQ